MTKDLTGKYNHREVGVTMVGKAYADSYRLSFVGKEGKPVTIHRSTAWVRRAIKQGDLVRCKEGVCPTS